LTGVLAVALLAGSSPVWAQEASPVATAVAPTAAAPQEARQEAPPAARGGVFVPAAGGPVERVPGPDGTELLLAADQRSAQIAAAAERRPVEIMGRRSETSSTWAMPNGTLSSRLAAGLGVTVRAPTAKFYVNARGKIVDDPGGRWLTYLPMVD
jgi:hypothetical protein